MADMTDAECIAYCPYFHHTIELIGRRWTGPTLMALVAGQQSYSDIRDAIPGISDRLLSERLKELEAEDIVLRTVDGRSALYQLTPRGEALGPVIEAVSTYAGEWVAPAT